MTDLDTWIAETNAKFARQQVREEMRIAWLLVGAFALGVAVGLGAWVL